MQYFVYIISNESHRPYYVGITNNLSRRIWEHKSKLVSGFSKKYNLDLLLYYESYRFVDYAISREKQLKKYKRDWKENLIKEINPEFKDLYYDLY